MNTAAAPSVEDFPDFDVVPEDDFEPDPELVERAVKIPTARAFVDFLRPARYKGAYGGRGGAKSKFFGGYLVETAMLQPTRAVCIREVQRSLSQSVKLLIEDYIREWKLTDVFQIKNNYIGAPYGGVFIFNGMQNHTAESIKSLEGYNRAWVEEAQSLTQRSLDLLRPTIRAKESELWFTWNPRRASDPIDQLLRGPKLPPGAIIRRVNWQDNPWFPKVLRDEMEWDRSRDPEKYAHIWMGEYERNAEARVFKNWKVEEFDTPADAVFYLGADWGFSVDPSTLVRCFIQGRNLFIDYERYAIGVEIDHLPAHFDALVCGCQRGFPCEHPQHGMARQWQVRADSARPETISYLNRNGYPRMVPATKGQNSVKEGVVFLQGYDIVVHPRCTHTIDELTMYSFKTDKMTGVVIPVLEDKKNHVIDPLRYSVEPLRNPVGLGDMVTW